MSDNKHEITFPFSAIIGQDDFKLALILNLVDPLIGGVLAIGDKGTGKTTLIRSLSSLMSGQNNFPFVNLPIGVTEDRLLGSIDLEQLINTKKEEVNLGLMAQAHRGILYADEVNLLQDYLTDILLDATASGRYFLEREGISKYFDSQFCLVGSMNPEEGNLRPQLKDRFGLSVAITTPTDIKTRQQIIRQRLDFDDNSQQFVEKYKSKDGIIAKQIEAAKSNLQSISFDESILEYCSSLALQHQVEGLRADVLLLKTARAYVAYQNKNEIQTKDVDRIANFVLNHRSTNNFNQQNSPQDQSNGPQETPTDNGSSKEDNISILKPKNEFQKLKSEKTNNNQIENQSRKHSNGNIIETDTKKTVSQYVATDKFEIKSKRKKATLKPHHIFLIDSSGSMMKDQIIAYAKGTVSKLAEQIKTQITHFSVVSLFDGTAQTLLMNSGILNEIERELEQLKTGGKTNLVLGLKQVKSLCADTDFSHHLHVITDGKLNEGNHLEDVVLAFQTYCKGLNSTHIVDAEKGIVKIGVAADFAKKINAQYEVLIVGNE